MEKILGLIDAPFTPFYENGEVNLEPIEQYAKMLAKNGLKGVLYVVKQKCTTANVVIYAVISFFYSQKFFC